MNFKEHFKNLLLQPEGFSFEEMALKLFHYQAQHNTLYQSYLIYLKKNPKEVKKTEQIPFLPVSFFKHHDIVTGDFKPERTFLSSGTTLQSRSRHLVADVRFYLQHASRIFQSFYGPVSDYLLLALLPSYQEQGHSSLILMVEHFMRESGQEEHYFFRRSQPDLFAAVDKARHTNRKVILVGVTYALLDLAAEASPAERALLREAIIMETGGMKGRRREMIRAEVHEELMAAFGTPAIHSEYGMTELLSQAYSAGQGIFRCPAAMRLLLRDPNDPLDVRQDRASGGINVIDLANVDSCAFIETQDLGRLHPDGSFEVLGRFDNSDIRGCNLLLA
jgi:non-ribosomal peptide synthetase component F